MGVNVRDKRIHGDVKAFPFSLAFTYPSISAIGPGRQLLAILASHSVTVVLTKNGAHLIPDTLISDHPCREKTPLNFPGPGCHLPQWLCDSKKRNGNSEGTGERGSGKVINVHHFADNTTSEKLGRDHSRPPTSRRQRGHFSCLNTQWPTCYQVHCPGALWNFSAKPSLKPSSFWVDGQPSKSRVGTWRLLGVSQSLKMVSTVPFSLFPCLFSPSTTFLYWSKEAKTGAVLQLQTQMTKFRYPLKDDVVFSILKIVFNRLDPERESEPASMFINISLPLGLSK